MSKSVKRLFKQFSPNHYQLKIIISEDKKTFSGSVLITGKRNGRPSERMTLHQKNLKITNSKIFHIDKKKNKKEIKILRTNLHKTYDELRLHTVNTIYPGEYEISLDFSGDITKNMDGIYPCNYKDKNVDKSLIATQFESHHAREVFPCIDEPEAKATFQLNLTHSKDEIALSNTTIKNETIDKKVKTTEFAETPIMSTYLLAFIVGELEFKEARSKNDVLIRTYATKEQVKNTEFALDIAVKCIDFYEDYYDIPFPLTKCDFVALPDFASGAMENWGLITFREQTLLVDNDNTSLGTRQYVALVVAHELTHQWFGNLVTMEWWTDLWLNEGFASWMEYLAIDKIYPEWHLWTQFTVDEQQIALNMDSLEHTHPVEVGVKHPDEIRSIFDAISYQKGASVIHMLHSYLGSVGFRDGLRHYLKKHSYKNTGTIDLWQALEDTSKKPVKQFMGAWTSQNGYPILNVEQVNDHFKITQSRFVTDPTSEARNDNTLWPIPLHSSNQDKTIISKKVTKVPFNKNVPIKLNLEQTGFYRVNYSLEIEKNQLNALDKNQISDIDRMGLLSDSFEVTKAGYQPITEYLDLLVHFKEEQSLAVWEIIAPSIGHIRNVLSKNDEDNLLRDAAKPFIRELIDIQLNRLEWDENPKDSHLDKMLRPIIIGFASIADDKIIIEKINKSYLAKIDKSVHINPNLRGTIYNTIARNGTQKEFDELLNLYKNTDSSDAKLSITSALTSFKQPEIISQTLALIKTDTVRLQDIGYWIAYSLMNRHSRKATWEWLILNWDWLVDNIGSDMSFARMPLYVARNFADKDFVNIYKDFFEPRLNPTIQRTYDQGLEILHTNIAHRLRDSDIALKWFKNY